MVKVIRKIVEATDQVKKKGKLFGDIWMRRINSAVSQLIAVRLAVGKIHEGEAGLLISRFIKETFRTFSTMRKIDRLSKSPLGKSYIVKVVLDNIPMEKRSTILKEISKVKDREGVDFIEALEKILESTLGKENYKKVDAILGSRLSHALVSDRAIFDVVDQKLYAYDEATGSIIEKKLDLKNPNDLIELLSYDLYKKQDLRSDYAEWKMLKLIEEGEAKGLKGKSLGLYIYSRIGEELQKDEVFRHGLIIYLVKHFDRLEKSREVMSAFGDLLISYSKFYEKIVSSVVRAMGRVPFIGPLAESGAALGGALSELGEDITRTLKKSKNRS